MKRSNTTALALALILGLSGWSAQAVASPGHGAGGSSTRDQATARARTSVNVHEHATKTTFHANAQTSVRMHQTHFLNAERSVKTNHTKFISSHAVQPHPAVMRHTIVRHEIQKHITSQRIVTRSVETFSGRTRVIGRVTSIANSHVIVTLPNGTRRTFIAFRQEGFDRDRFVFRSNGVTRTFRVINVSRPIANRFVVVMNEVEVERVPELTVLRTVALDDDEVMFVEPTGVLVPFAVTAIEPLPGARVAIFGDDFIPETFVPANVTFVGQVVGIGGPMVTFLLPDGTTRTLFDPGVLPVMGSDVVVLENGSQVVSFSPAVTDFVGQVVAVDNPFVTFVLPNGTMRTLVVSQTVPAPGTRVLVFENGDRVDRLLWI